MMILGTTMDETRHSQQTRESGMGLFSRSRLGQTCFRHSLYLVVRCGGFLIEQVIGILLADSILTGLPFYYYHVTVRRRTPLAKEPGPTNSY